MEFFYAKLNFFYGIFSDKNSDVTSPQYRFVTLEAALKSGSKIEANGSSFSFSDVSDFTIDKKNFLYGKLIKYADREEKVANEAALATEFINVPDRVLSESHFFIEFGENFLFYTQSKAHLNKNSFLDKFNDLLKAGLSDGVYDCVAYPVSDQYTFFDKLTSLSEVLSLELVIFPTNPFPHEEIAAIDDTLKAQNAKLKSIKYRGKTGGLNVNHKEIKDNTIYADIGYGKADADGFDKRGKRVKISSKRSDRQKCLVVDKKITNPFIILQKIK